MALRQHLLPVGRVFISTTRVALHKFEDFVDFPDCELSAAKGDLFFLVLDRCEQVAFRRQQIPSLDAVYDPLVTVHRAFHVRT